MEMEKTVGTEVCTKECIEACTEACTKACTDTFSHFHESNFQSFQNLYSSLLQNWKQQTDTIK